MSEFSLLGEWIGQQKFTLVYGGTATGAMQTLADSCLKAGGHALGIVPSELSQMPRINHANHSYELVDSLAVRKTKMMNAADVIVTGPGGLGTLDEFTDALTLKTLGRLNAKLVLHNPFDFWTPLIDLFSELHNRGAMNGDHSNHFVTTSSFQDLIENIKSR
jgi:uncharacterized protein (TIGR00730 family)